MTLFYSLISNYQFKFFEGRVTNTHVKETDNFITIWLTFFSFKYDPYTKGNKCVNERERDGERENDNLFHSNFMTTRDKSDQSLKWKVFLLVK